MVVTRCSLQTHAVVLTAIIMLLEAAGPLDYHVAAI